MRLAIVSIDEGVSVQIPISRVVRDIHAQCGQYCTVVPLHLPICFGMVRDREVVLYGQYAAYVQEEFAWEARTVVRYQLHRWSVIEHPVIDEGFCNLQSGDAFHWSRLGEFRKTIRDD